jgi:gamma-carbonic anhydrase
MIGKFLDIIPKIAGTSFIAPSADIIGAVEIGKYSSVWFNVVVRADINRIKIGAYTNIQDGCVLHVDDEADVYIGNYVTVGHNAVLHACHIGDGSLIGMGAIILNGARIGKGSIIAAGALITKDQKIPAYTLVMGSPGKIVRTLTKEEKDENIYWAKKYSKLIPEYKKIWKTKRY